MKKPRPVAVVGAGNLAGSSLSRFWGLRDQLGPIKCSSLRVASRAANYLGAGRPVADYEDFAECRMILICVPDHSAASIVSELARSGLKWRDKAIVLSSDLLDSSILHPLACAGASAASVCPIPGFDHLNYLVEGHRPAVREVKRLVLHRGARVVAIEPPLKPLYLAALLYTSAGLVPALTAAAQCLRQARVPPDQASAILAKQTERALRGFLKAGRKTYRPPRDIERHLQPLAGVYPELAEYLEASLHAAENVFGLRRKQTVR